MAVKARYNVSDRDPLCTTSLNSSSCSSDTGSCNTDLSSCTDASSLPSDRECNCTAATNAMEALMNDSRLHDRCIITHEKQPSSSLVHTYILSFERMDESQTYSADSLLTQLSYVWGFNVGSGERWLPNTPINIAPMMSTWRLSFNDCELLLLPQTDVINQIYETVQRQVYPRCYGEAPRPFQHYTKVLVPDVYKYHIVPINPDNCMPDPDVAVYRRSWPVEIRVEGKRADPPYEVFQSPFEGLVIESHIHPYMAIADAMLKLPTLLEGGRIPRVYWRTWDKAHLIWRLWTQFKIPSSPQPPVAPCAYHFVPPSDNNQSSDCVFRSTSVSRKRKACEEPAFRARKVGALRIPFLDSDGFPSSSVWDCPTTAPTPSKRSRPDEILRSSSLSGQSGAARSVAAWVAQSARPLKRARRTPPPPLPRRKFLDELVRAAPAGDWKKWTPEWPAWVAKDMRIAKVAAAEGVVRPSRGHGARRQRLGDT